MKESKLQKLVETAETWAETMHKGQKYKEEDYFQGHIKAVVDTTLELMEKGQWIFLSKTDRYLAVVIAYLHDIVEDTDVSIEDIRKTFGSVVAQEIVYLTKTKNTTREQQWAMAKRGSLATLIKKADLLVNLKKSIANDNKRLIEKYLTGLAVLNDLN